MTATEEELIEIPRLDGERTILSCHSSFLYVSDSFGIYRLDKPGIVTLESRLQTRDVTVASTLAQTLQPLSIDPETAWVTQHQFLHLTEETPRHLLGEGRPNLFLLKKEERRPARQPGNLFVLVAYFYTVGKAAMLYEAGFDGVWTKDPDISARVFIRQPEPPRPE